MRMSNKKKIILVIGLLAVAITAAVWFVWAQDLNLRPEADLQMAADLSALSGLSKDTVLNIYDAVGSWDTVRQNIFVYKRILSLADKESYDDAFDIFRDYQAPDILAVYEFLSANGDGFGDAEKLMKERAKGTKWEEILAAYLDNKLYKVYQPAGDDQIRQWLNAGYLPQDIINADSIARAKDMQIAKVLELKTDTTTWEQIAQKLKYKFNYPKDKDVSLSVYEAGGTKTISGADYETVVEKANAEAEKTEKEAEDKVRGDFGLTDTQIEIYKSRGFTLHDIENAARLAQKSNTPMDKILQERLDGKSWEEIIKVYSG